MTSEKVLIPTLPCKGGNGSKVTSLILRLPLRQAQGTLRTSGKEPFMLSPSINSGQAPPRSGEVEAQGRILN
jgi:hypothetical protein